MHGLDRSPYKKKGSEKGHFFATDGTEGSGTGGYERWGVILDVLSACLKMVIAPKKKYEQEQEQYKLARASLTSYPW